MNRFDRIMPYVAAMPLIAVLLMGIAWDASFEATPTNGDLVSQGDDRVRELKQEIADRGEDELCWGTGHATGCPGAGDNGFAREGSGRGFFDATAPTTLNDQAATALAAGHDGRFWIDSDGTDNVDANLDDNSIHFWNGSAFEKLGLGALGTVDFVTGAPASGNLLRFNGTSWLPVTPAVLITRDVADFAVNEAFTNETCAACTVAGVPDMTGGSDTNNYPKITVPASPSGVTWDVYVYGHLLITHDSGDGSAIGCELEEDINDVDTFTGAVSSVVVSVVNGGTSTCTFMVLTQPAATAGNTYAYRVKLDGFTGNEDYTVEDAAVLPTDFENDSELVVEVRPRTLY